jgi:hypothetical protein
MATALGTAAPATAAPRPEAGTAQPASTVRAGSPAAEPAVAPAAPAHRPRDPSYPPTTGRLYLSTSRARVGSTVAAMGTGFRPRTSVLVIVQVAGSGSGGSDTAAALAATGVGTQRSARGRGCATNRVCVVRANPAGLALFTVRLTEVGRTTVTAIGLTPQGTVQTLTASVQVLPRRSGHSAGDGSAGAGQAPAPARAPATPMTAAGLLLTSVAGLALRRRLRHRTR